MSQSERGSLSQDVVYDLLSNPRRRFVLSYLRQRDEPVEIGELADEIAAWENETDVEDLTRQQRKRVYVSIYQSHIPKLEDAGVVEYDRERGTVSLRDRVREIDRHLQREREEPPWQLVYLGLAALSALFYGAVALGLPVFDLLSTTVAAGVVVVAFGVVAVSHFLYSRYVDSRMPPEFVDTRE